MHGIYSDWGLVLPSEWLVWLATSSVRLAVYRLQVWHGPLRLAHVGGSAAFFGAILLRGRSVGLPSPRAPGG